jgi:transposase-like protein
MVLDSLSAQTAQTAMAQGGQSVSAQFANTCDFHGRGSGRRPGLLTLPHRTSGKLHSTNPIERLNGEIKRRTNVHWEVPYM